MTQTFFITICVMTSVMVVISALLLTVEFRNPDDGEE